ncbi:MAG: glucokinase, partial [Pseudomonadota bacterium]|nr:glucokinase [Pseudomonadota bacterium]
MSESTVLVGDIGGTNARFAIARPAGPGFESERVLLCDDFISAESAIQQYLEEVSAPPVRSACLAVAGPVAEGKASLTNNHWLFDEASLRAALSCERVKLLNDFEAAALGVVELGPVDLTPVGPAGLPDLSQTDFVTAVVGPGTGFGAATLIKRDGRLTSLSGEAGHVGF